MRAYLDAGCGDVRVFWDLSLAEISELLASAARRYEQEATKAESELKLQAVMYRNLAVHIAEGVSMVLGTGKKFTPLEKMYPSLFQPKEMSLEAYTLVFTDYAERINERRARNNG